MQFHAFFLETPAGPRFALHHPAQGATPRGLVLAIHAFAEEMNKTRRMAALQSRALAAAGWHVLQLDLHGCGDSDGDLGDASWNGWLDDIAAGAQWLRGQQRPDAPPLPLCLWGTRAGALLAAQALHRQEAAIGPAHLLLWQPVLQGKAQLQQFLRLVTAAGASAGTSTATAAGTDQPSLRQQLSNGQTVEVAGYRLNASLAEGLEAAALTPCPASAPQRLIWLECSPLTPPRSQVPAAAALQAWREAGWTVHSHTVSGPPFWQTVEIEEAPALLDATLQAMAEPFAILSREAA